MARKEAIESHDIIAFSEQLCTGVEKKDLLHRHNQFLQMVYAYKGAAYLELGMCAEAIQEYQRALEVDDTDVADEIYHKAAVGYCQAFYTKLGKYDELVSLDKQLHWGRSFRIAEGVHKYTALSQKAKGDIDAARRTMSRAILYEAPWSKENKARNLKILSDL